MTTDLEKQFFSTFGLGITESFETRFRPVAPYMMRDRYNGKILEVFDDDNWRKNFQNNYLKKYPYKGRLHYPRITDTHYLQLISLQSAYLRQKGIECCYMTCAKTLDELKKEILQDCIDYEKDIKSQVQALFKE